MSTAKIILKDEVNCKITGLDVNTRKKLVGKFKFLVPYARHLPSVKLGRWDGKIAFFQLGGSTYINLLPKIIPMLESFGYELELEDQRQPQPDFKFTEVDHVSYSYIKWPEGHTLAGQPIILNDHQVVTINNALHNIQSIQEVATGAGKTIVTAILSQKCEQYGRTIVIVPSRTLVEQTEEDYLNLGLDVGVFYGSRKEFGKTHTICTWQSLASLDKKTKNGEAPITFSEFLRSPDPNSSQKDVVAVIVDEAHGAKADVLKNMLTQGMAHIPIRWGLTGTVPKEDFQSMSLKVSLGEVVGKVTAKSLQDKGILAQCTVNILQMLDWKEFGNYQSEMKYLTSDEERLEYLSYVFREIGLTGNTLILVNYISTGKILESSIPNSIFLSGGTHAKTRKEEYDKVRTEDNKVIIATYGIAAVGVNIPRIFNLVLLEPGKSFVRVIQSIGRGIRIAQDKDHVHIWDITSNCKYAKRHLTERKKFYKEAGYPFTIEKIDWRD